MIGNAIVRGACTIGTAVMLVSLGFINPACSTPASPASPPQPTELTGKPPVEPMMVSPPPNVPLAQNRIEVIFFYLPFRCYSCKCWEESSANAVTNYFQKELSNGTLTFQTIEIGDRKKADLLRKYDPYGSQLFINVIRDGADHITNIKEIASWKCGEGADFEERVKDIIETNLHQIN